MHKLFFTRLSELGPTPRLNVLQLANNIMRPVRSIPCCWWYPIVRSARKVVPTRCQESDWGQCGHVRSSSRVMKNEWDW